MSNATNNEVNNKNLDQLAETLENTDGVEVVGHVDIANKSVQDVLVVKGSIKDAVDQEDAKSEDEPSKESGKESKDKSEKAHQDKDDKKDKSADKANIKDKVEDKALEVKEQAQDKLDAAKEQVSEVKEAATSLKEEVEDKAYALKDQALEKADAVKTQALDKAQTLKADAEDKFDDLKAQGEAAIDDAKAKTDEALETAKTKAQSVQSDIEDKAAELKDKVSGAIDAAKDKASELKQQAEEAVSEATVAAQSVADDLKNKFDDFKADAQEKVDAIKADAEQKGAEFKEKAEQLGGDIKSKADDAVEFAKDKVDAVAGDVERIQAENADKPESGILAKIGAYFAGVGASKRTNFVSVDLNNQDFGEDAFRTQAATIGSQLFGGKLATAQSLVGKVAPSANAEGISKAIFDKAAHWANNWAKKDLQKDSRFGKLANLTDAERDDFARDVANQNRALAVMGGLSGLFGIKGVVADTAWLLMVSLKSVYQLALIYDKPLTGADGIKLAYGVLSGANLSKLQEKQVILTALALGNAFFINAQDSGLKQELQKVGLKYRTGDTFAKQLDDLSHFIDIDKLNVSWFKRILPVASVGTSAYYNRELIEEVLGTAMATFRPERPQLLVQQGEDDVTEAADVLQDDQNDHA
ncbi:EcsC family protein [Moraxella nasibovis]|uniref:EcsC family protein n=1 Tax=Moraxella nasibovis TaxID=2904120 RepID=UPI00240EC1C8|nr:EcsC family protein [Moraxella nasibovis]WFF38446.1 EcsC family protein [Moraxella nasibovis]